MIYDHPALRRKPVQNRSRRQVDHLLDAAERLLVQHGTPDLKPTAVAREADVPIATLYQYFEDGTAILRVLVQRYFDNVEMLAIGDIESAASLDDVFVILRESTARWFEAHRSDPALQAQAQVVLAEPILLQESIADSRRIADRLQATLCKHRPEADPLVVWQAALLVNHLFIGALQLALASESPEEQEALFRRWYHIAELALLDAAGAT